MRNSDIKKILVTRTDRIGDIILTTPALQAIKEMYPTVELHVMVLPYTAEILEGNPYVDKIIVYDKRGKHKSFMQTIRFARTLSREHYDVAIHLHPTNRVHIISFVAGIARRIGYNRNFSFLLTDSIPENKHKGLKHESEYAFELLSFVHVKQPRILKPFFSVNAEHEKELFSLLKEQKIDVKKIISFFPSASCPSKMWPVDSFVELAQSLIDAYNVGIFLVGGQEDRDVSDKIVEKVHGPVFNVTGLLSLKQLGALFKNSLFVVSNDSGPAHIAAALDTPVVTIFGRNDPGLHPRRWHPLGEKSFYLHQPLECIECRAHNCIRSFACLRAVTPQDVFGCIRQNILKES